MKTYRLNILTQGWPSHDDDEIWKQSKSIWSLEVKKKDNSRTRANNMDIFYVVFLSRHSNFHVRVISWNFNFCARANYYSVNKLEKIRGGEV